MEKHLPIVLTPVKTNHIPNGFCLASIGCGSKN